MTEQPKVTKRASPADILRMANAISAAVGFAPCADVSTLLARIKERIDEHEAELSKLVGAKRALRALIPHSQSGRWEPRPGTTYARILSQFGEGATLTHHEVVAAIAVDGGPALPIGSVSGGLSTLGKNGWLVKEGGAWRRVDATVS